MLDIIVVVVAGILCLFFYKDKIVSLFKKNKTDNIVVNSNSDLLQKVQIWENLQNLAQKEDLKAKLNDIFPLLNKDNKNDKVGP